MKRLRRKHENVQVALIIIEIDNGSMLSDRAYVEAIISQRATIVGFHVYLSVVLWRDSGVINIIKYIDNIDKHMKSLLKGQ